MKIVLDAENKCCKNAVPRVSPKNEREIAELRKKIDAKNKEIIKCRDDTANSIDLMRKDCASRFQKEEMKNLTKDFGALKGTMEKLIKAKKGEDDSHTKLRTDLSKTHTEVKNLKGVIMKEEDACCCP